MNQKKHDVFLTTGFPIRNSPDQSLFGSSPKLIAAFHVLRHPLAPRHPSCTLSSLITKIILRFCDLLPLSTILLSKNNDKNPKHSFGFYYFPYSIIWWRWAGSNRQPRPCRGRALPIELHPLDVRSCYPVRNTFCRDGGPKWIRTTDLSLIRGTL